MAQRPVADNGLWNLPRPTISHDTKNLLQTMMRESRLTNFQQRQLDNAANSGDSLPQSCHPTSSASKCRQASHKNRQPVTIGKVLNPRNYSSQTRTRQQIEATGAYDREQYQPTPLNKYNGVYEKDKVRLANMMAYGQDIVPTGTECPDRANKGRRQGQGRDKDVNEREEDNVDRFNELEMEVEERKSFLRQMEHVGKADQYRRVIETQISQMVREMEVIDAKHTQQLNSALADRQLQTTTTPPPAST